MPGHGVNPIFFNEKNKDWTSRTLATLLPRAPPTPITSHFRLTPYSPQSVSPLTRSWSLDIYFNSVDWKKY